MKEVLWKVRQKTAAVLSVSMLLVCISPMAGLAKEYTEAPIGGDPVNEYGFELPEAKIKIKPAERSKDVNIEDLKDNNEISFPFSILVDFGEIASPGNASSSDWDADVWADQIASELEFNPGVLASTKETAEKLGAVVSVEKNPYTIKVKFDNVQEENLNEREKITVALNPDYYGLTYPNVSRNVSDTNPGFDINISSGPAMHDEDYFPVVEPSWIEGYPGWAGWNNTVISEKEKEEINRVNVHVFRDSELLTTRGSVSSRGYSKNFDVRELFTEPGTYTFKASFNKTNNWQIPDEDRYWSEECVPFEYKLPAKTLSTPKNLRWKSNGTAVWNSIPKTEKDAIKNFKYYMRLHVKDEETGEFRSIGTYFKINKEEVDVSAYLEADRTYKFQVMAVGDLVQYANSSFSAFSNEFVMSPIRDKGETLIDGLINTEDVKESVENTTLSEDEKGTLKLAVQAYGDVADKYAELEAQYAEAAGKEEFTVETGESGVDAEQVKVIGGILNGAAGLQIEKPQEQDLVDAQVSKYRKRFALNITLATPSEAVGNELKYPVLITMPIPKELDTENFDPENLIIIHVKHDGSKESIRPRVNGDGTVSFAVTEFSTFYFADSTSVSSSGGSGGSGSGGGSSTSSAGTTITDSKKGRVNSITGIITGSGDSYSKWIAEEPQTGNGIVRWKLQYADGTFAAGTYVLDELGNPVKDAAGNMTEQPSWELINGAWYAFGVDGYAKSGMVFDPAQNGWFYIDINMGMKTGWQQIDGNWHYFNPSSNGTQGKMAVSTTVDGYTIDENGVWIQ